jgi:phosphoglycolate phosphatase-like HAD superfamily hydrolase
MRSALARHGVASTWEGIAKWRGASNIAQGRPSTLMLIHAMDAARVDSVAEVVAVGKRRWTCRPAEKAAARAAHTHRAKRRGPPGADGVETLSARE